MSTIPKDFPLKGAVLAHGEVDGITWVAARAPIYGAVNGYCRVPENHPWLNIAEEWDIETSVPWGEITYRDGNWVGFDTLHAGQHWPGQSESPFNIGPLEGDLLMTEATVIGWAKRLASDAAAALADGGEAA